MHFGAAPSNLCFGCTPWGGVPMACATACNFFTFFSEDCVLNLKELSNLYITFFPPLCYCVLFFFIFLYFLLHNVCLRGKISRVYFDPKKNNLTDTMSLCMGFRCDLPTVFSFAHVLFLAELQKLYTTKKIKKKSTEKKVKKYIIYCIL